MSVLTQSTPQEIQARFGSAYSAAASRPANLGPGSSLGAIQNGLVALSTDLQQQAAYAANLTRLATSASTIPGVNSPDVDSFVNQFLIYRNQAVAATLQVTFGCNGPAPSGGYQINAFNETTQSGGTYVGTSNSIQFIVIPDTTQPGYNSGLNAYVIAQGQTSVTATVQAVVPGVGGNVQANTIQSILSLPGSPAPIGITSVNNPSGTNTGVAEETDAALLIRFAQIMSSKWATPLAVSAAVDSVQNGLTWQVGDMLDQFGNVAPNFFAVIVNALGQSTGPSAPLLAAVGAAVQADRPLGMPYTVTGPSLQVVAGSATITLVGGANPSTVTAALTTAVENYLNEIGMINGVITNPDDALTIAEYSEIIVVIRGVSGVANVTNLLINGGTSDVTAGYGQQIVAGSFTWTTQ